MFSLGFSGLNWSLRWCVPIVSTYLADDVVHLFFNSWHVLRPGHQVQQMLIRNAMNFGGFLGCCLQLGRRHKSFHCPLTGAARICRWLIAVTGSGPGYWLAPPSRQQQFCGNQKSKSRPKRRKNAPNGPARFNLNSSQFSPLSVVSIEGTPFTWVRRFKVFGDYCGCDLLKLCSGSCFRDLLSGFKLSFHLELSP